MICFVDKIDENRTAKKKKKKKKKKIWMPSYVGLYGIFKIKHQADNQSVPMAGSY